MKWHHLPTNEAMWEITKGLLNQFKNVDLEDKSPLPKEGIDKLRRS